MGKNLGPENCNWFTELLTSPVQFYLQIIFFPVPCILIKNKIKLLNPDINLYVKIWIEEKGKEFSKTNLISC